MSSPQQHSTPNGGSSVRPSTATGANRVTSPRDPTSITSLLNNTSFLAEDLKHLERYVKELLFYKIIFIQDRKGEERGTILRVHGPLYMDFFKTMSKNLGRGKLVGKPIDDVHLYVEKVWTSGLDQSRKGNIQKRKC